MARIARVSTDTAQGVITGPGSSTVRADGKKVSIERDRVAGHGDSPHSAPSLTSNYQIQFLQTVKKLQRVEQLRHAVILFRLAQEL